MINREVQKDSSSTFISNMSLPIHGWFRYSAGFSADWVEETIKQQLLKNNAERDFRVLDPFAGSGTTLIACNKIGITSYGYESHSLIARIAAIKLLWETDVMAFKNKAGEILDLAKSDKSAIYRLQ